MRYGKLSRQLASLAGLIAMWAVFALDENIRGLIFLRRWNSFKWVGKSFIGKYPA